MNPIDQLPPEARERMKQMAHGTAAAAAVRANGGLPAHIDAAAAPDTCEIAGVILHCYPIATYCAMNQIQPWIMRIIQSQPPPPAEEKDAKLNLPIEVMLAQVFAFARPNEAYFRARNGEGDYMIAAFNWSNKALAGPDRWERLGRCYKFVLEQIGLLQSVNPPTPETRNQPETAPAPSPAPEPTSAAAAMPDSSLP